MTQLNRVPNDQMSFAPSHFNCNQVANQQPVANNMPQNYPPALYGSQQFNQQMSYATQNANNFVPMNVPPPISTTNAIQKTNNSQTMKPGWNDPPQLSENYRVPFHVSMPLIILYPFMFSLLMLIFDRKYTCKIKSPPISMNLLSRIRKKNT